VYSSEIPPNEKLNYIITFRGIPAGEATINVETNEYSQKIQLSAKSYPVIDVFYPIRVSATSVFSIPDFYLTSYEKISQEGHGKEKTEKIIIDHSLGVLTYSKNNKEKKKLEAPKDIQDPFSCIYAYRRFSDNISEKALNITDGKKIIKGTVNIIRQEKIETPAGAFDTILVEPVMEGVKGVFSKSPGSRLFVWLSNDERKIPVQLKSSISIGDFTAVLVKTNYNKSEKILQNNIKKQEK
jgi:hypothetical protein